MNAYEVENITFFHKNQKVLSDITVVHKQGDIGLWLGPSGGGKTSLAKIICSHLKVSSGQVLIHGKGVTTPSLDRLYVCHENDLFMWQTLQQHINFLLKNVNIPNPPEMSEINKWAEMLEVSHLLKKYSSHISMGEARRFQILRSLILRSNLVIFDEIFSALDAKLKQRIMPKLLEIWKSKNASVVIISHESDQNFNISFDQTLDFSLLPSLSER
ncbi:ATP-binding cassette domain-containing protein [bacterium]|nr:ATP-binding cassette domain-containing protein [bacterium]